MTTPSLNDRVAAYFGHRMGWGDVQVRDSRRISGGISRETWRFAIDVSAADGSLRRDVIVRLDPPTSLLESRRDIEYALFQAFDGVPGVPVPKTLCNEPDASHLGATFMATAVLPGVADIPSIATPPFAATGRQIALAHFTAAGTISRLVPASKGLDRLLPAPRPENSAAEALAHWEAVWRAHPLAPAPITEAALRLLQRHLPPPAARIGVVHGDFRLGNCLYLPDGTLSGVLDWEMAHLGDPLEDLAWALHPDWRPSAAPPDRVAGHLSEDEAIAAWSAASGLPVDPAALRWWRLFSCVKASAIFATGASHFVANRGGDVVYALSAWFNLDNEEAQMLQWMGVTA